VSREPLFNIQTVHFDQFEAVEEVRGIWVERPPEKFVFLHRNHFFFFFFFFVRDGLRVGGLPNQVVDLGNGPISCPGAVSEWLEVEIRDFCGKGGGNVSEVDEMGGMEEKEEKSALNGRPYNLRDISKKVF
jgi:hypothetical protein